MKLPNNRSIPLHVNVATLLGGIALVGQRALTGQAQIDADAFASTPSRQIISIYIYIPPLPPGK